MTATPGLDPETTIPDLQAIIEHAILNRPRTLQTTIGPSSLGSECDRCLIEELAGLKEPEPDAAWMPQIGVALGEWLEGAIIQHLMATGSDRYIPEGRVLVGTVGGVEVWGNSDLFDLHTGTVVDYKLVGTTTLRDTRRHGVKATYRKQVQLYGKGWQDQGYDVRSVAVWMLPRNGFTVGSGFLWQEPYDRADAEATIARADMFANAIQAYGAETVLAAAPDHAGTEFSCPKEDKSPKTPDAFLGVG